MKAVIFDMDGVIFNTEKLWQYAFIESNKIYNVNLTEEYRKTICGKSEELIREELKNILPNVDVNAYRDYMVDYVNNNVKNGNFEMKGGFVELINALKNKNYKLALATSSTKDRALMLFNRFSINPNDIFDAFVFAEDVGTKSKPDPFMFRLAASKIGVKEEESFVIEDSLNGIVAAYKGGFKPIMVIDLIEPDDFAKKNCYKIFNNLNEVIDII